METPAQQELRKQWEGQIDQLTPYWAADKHGKDLTFRHFPPSVKIDFVNAMGKGPAFWPAEHTISRVENYVSTQRSKSNSKRKKVRCVVVNVCSRMCFTWV